MMCYTIVAANPLHVNFEGKQRDSLLSLSDVGLLYHLHVNHENAKHEVESHVLICLP